VATLKRYRAGSVSDSSSPSRATTTGTDPGVALNAKSEALHMSVAQRDQVISHCRSVCPQEGCGLLSGDAQANRVHGVHPIKNLEASERRYTLDPREHLLVGMAAEAVGQAVIGVFHSHPSSEAYPSPIDVGLAPDPSWHYVIVSFTRPDAVMRSYRIVGGLVREEAIEVG